MRRDRAFAGNGFEKVRSVVAQLAGGCVSRFPDMFRFMGMVSVISILLADWVMCIVSILSSCKLGWVNNVLYRRRNIYGV